MINEYNNLVKLVNKNLKDSNIDCLVFELEENIKETIYHFPYDKLLEIEDNRQFLYEVYYKILDRVIDKLSYERLYIQLEENKISKEQIIKNIIKSEESKIKNTLIVYR